jgi:hypothetical protein
MGTHRRRLMASLAGLAVLLAVGGAGCKTAPEKQVTVIDGVETIVNPAKPMHKDPGRVLKVRGKLRIRDTGNRFYFKGPERPDIGPDGSIYVREFGQLLRFSPDGSFLGSLINPGQGPGEIEMPLDCLIEGDGIRVMDGGRLKVVHMTPDGRFLDELKLDREYGTLTRNWFVGLQSFLPQRRGVLADGPHNFICASRPDGAIQKTFPFSGRSFHGQGFHFFWDTPRWVADAGRDLLFISISREYGIKVLDLNLGRVVRSFSRVYPRVPYVVEAKIQAAFAKAGAPRPDFLDDVLDLFLSGAALWVRTSTVDAKKGQLFDVFSAEGDFLDSFFVRVRGKIIGVRGDTIFASEEAEDGTLAVVLYENLESGRT